jgi:nucleotide-binding universal stress UspA family protein
MFENILVAIDGSKHSDSAFDVAMDIAQKYNS